MTAALVAEISMTVLYVALEEWLDQDGDRALFEIILETLESMQTALASFPAGHQDPVSSLHPQAR